MVLFLKLDKKIREWNVDETLEYVRDNVVTKDQFKLTQAVRYMTQLAVKES